MAGNQDTGKLARAIRKDAVSMVYHARSSHLGAALSIADILAVLYGRVLNVRPDAPAWEKRDRLLLSKGHAGAALYAALAECGFFPPEKLRTYCGNGSDFSGHVSHRHVPGVEFSTGSLGHGLPVGAGLAFALKKQGLPCRVFVIAGDGECNEGTTYETALFAAQNRLDNLTLVIDRNRMQGLGNTEEILALEPLTDKFTAFRWRTLRIDGHDHAALEQAFAPVPDGRPCCIIADTVKGRGVSFMENKLEWHYRPPSQEEFEEAMAELEAQQ